LLETAVRRLKQMPPETIIDVDVDLPWAAYIPKSYVSDMRLKIDLYRRLGRVTNAEQLADFRAELIDRFGPPAENVERLLVLAELRIAAYRWKINSIHKENEYVVFGYSSPAQIRSLAASSRGRLRIVDGQSAYLPIPKGITQSDQMVADVKSLLQSS
jgi:transcription-repair coupling factor (superfamily II helicase)